MIRCLFIRGKLYEYIDKSLSEEDHVRVANHLETCVSCRTRVAQIGRVLSVAAQNTAPVPSEDFWNNFRAELDDKLNQKLVPSCPARAIRVRSALALATACLLIIAFSISLKTATRSPVRLAQSDKELIEELSSIEELSPELIPLDEFDSAEDFQPA
jgi:anti-sigma factor RsiW